MEIGKHPMIARLLKGAFHARLPLPHSTATLNVQAVLEHIEGMGTTTSLSLKQLSHTLCMVILKAADWSSESVFRNFYYQPTGDVTYGHAVLSRHSGSET